MSQLKVSAAVLVLVVVIFGGKVAARGDPKIDLGWWRDVMKRIWMLESNQEFKPCNAPEEFTLGRAYLERLVRDHGSTGIMAHAWPRMAFYRYGVFKDLYNSNVTITTQCTMQAEYLGNKEKLVCLNGKCAQCSNVPKSSAKLYEACNNLKDPPAQGNAEYKLEPEKEEEPPKIDACGWLDAENATKAQMALKKQFGEDYWMGTCNASAGLVMGRRYLLKFKRDEEFRGFFEHKMRYLKDWGKYAKATFCGHYNRRYLCTAKGADVGETKPCKVVSPRVCGPEGFCLECNDVKKEAGMLWEACHPEEPVKGVDCKKG